MKKSNKLRNKTLLFFVFLAVFCIYYISQHSVILRGQIVSQISQNTRIVALGDSLVVGDGSTSGNDFVSVLSRRIGLAIHNSGVIGLTTTQAINDLDELVISRDPDIVIIVLGGNDILQNVPQSQIIDNLRTIIQRIQNSGSRIILVAAHGSIFQSDREVTFANLAGETGASYVPNVLSGILGNPRYLSDLVHPNDQGYELIADRIFPVLQSSINSLPNQDLSATCKASRTTASTNQNVTWTAFVTGGEGNYRYEWSGTDGLQGSTGMTVKSYSVSGQKTASVTVMSGNTVVTQNCADTVTITEPVMTGFCNVTANSTPTGYTLSFNSIINGTATTTEFSWTGSDELTGNRQSVVKSYTTGGQKTATLTARSGNQTLSLTCSATIDPKRIATSTQSWSGSCSPSISALNVTWNSASSASGGISPYSFTWTGSDGLFASSSLVQKTYETDGIKSANIQIQGNEENHTLSCQAAISNTSGSAGGCFIATAAFGTSLDSHVITLRNFRDQKLLTNPLGTKFVQAYYKYSPPIADYIATKESLKLVTRVALWPIVIVAEDL